MTVRFKLLVLYKYIFLAGKFTENRTLLPVNFSDFCEILHSSLFLEPASEVWFKTSNTFFFFQPMFPFYTLKNTRDPLVFWCFKGVQNGSIGQDWLNLSLKMLSLTYKTFVTTQYLYS